KYLTLRLHRRELFLEVLKLFTHRCLAIRIGYRRDRFLEGHDTGHEQSLIGGHVHVRCYARAFPICFCDRTDRTSRWNEHSEMLADAETSAGMRSAAGCLADDGCAFEILQVVSEFFGA